MAVRRAWWGLSRFRPAQVIAIAFGGVLAAGTALLLLPISTQSRPATFIEALFTATSALCVTGHIVVDTPAFWSPFGQVVILALIQTGRSEEHTSELQSLMRIS